MSLDKNGKEQFVTDFYQKKLNATENLSENRLVKIWRYLWTRRLRNVEKTAEEFFKK